MKTGTIILKAALLFAVTTIQLPAADEVNDALQKGLVEEEANHNLDAAIKAYQSLTTRVDEQRKIAATAFFRLGECYRKQGKTNEAAVQYERVIRDFSDDARLVELSRKYLTEMGRVSSAELAARNPLSAAQKILDPAQVALLREEMSLVEFQLTLAQKRFENGKADLVEVTRCQRDLFSVKRKLPENSQPAAQKGLIEEEMKLVEQLLSEVKKRIEVGAAAPLDEVPLKRDLIGLKRELAAVADVSQPANPAAQSAEITDEEAKEILRIKAMIKNSPDLINAKDKQGDTLLHKAARLGQLTVAEFLLANQADVNARANDSSTPLHAAANSGHKAMTELLLANGADVNATEHQTALHLAVENGFKAVVEVLLANRADVNAARSNDGWTSLHIAALRGYKAIAELLLTGGADIHARNRDDFTPLHVAAQYGQKALIELLLARKADIDVASKDGSTPLNLAAGYGRPDAVKALVAGGADVNHQSSDRNTPLRSAVGGKSVEMVKSILAKKPNLELRDSEGLTPLQRSVLLNEPRLAELLLSAGAKANAAVPMDRTFQLTSRGPGEFWQGQPLLHWAIRSSNRKMVEVLLANGADVNAKDADGQTPLHRAVLYQLKDVTEILLKHGANVNLQDNEGRTPLDIAQPQANNGSRGLRGPMIGAPPGTPRTAAADLSTLQGNRAFASAPPGTQPAASQPAVASPSEIAQLLKQHGAIEDVQRPLRIGISRKVPAYYAAVFNKGPDDSNRFTLFELIATWQAPQVDPYGAALDPYRAASGLPTPYSGAVGLPFPDFANLKIHRLEPKGGEREIKVDLIAVLESGDCSKDTWLEWGDVVEIPERDHKLNEQWQGLPQQVLDSLQRCVKRTVDIIVKGQTTKVTLVPSATSASRVAAPSFQTRLQQIVDTSAKTDAARNGPVLQNCWLSHVVRNVNVLLASSDLSRVQLKRVDPVTKQTREFIFNLDQAEPRNDLWLRDGDVIEVPEKQ